MLAVIDLRGALQIAAVIEPRFRRHRERRTLAVGDVQARTDTDRDDRVIGVSLAPKRRSQVRVLSGRQQINYLAFCSEKIAPFLLRNYRGKRRAMMPLLASS